MYGSATASTAAVFFPASNTWAIYTGIVYGADWEDATFAIPPAEPRGRLMKALGMFKHQPAEWSRILLELVERVRSAREPRRTAERSEPTRATRYRPRSTRRAPSLCLRWMVTA